ncbi:glycoside hydrolase family 15 protein [Glycomyces luteolus]|uniref:Glycoside hydrolase family 15 protein n=1 Tax=Glycomyces luteolus TaxID=2670330 RepID=A0A9X3P9G0_9ACTN|nr:glycoside hydrolase family 15 protein [Glycomyces luteolus]MDA1360046.1 glycoside hydrolase family 15 protein [Glycomyces luteolus]
MDHRDAAETGAHAAYRPISDYALISDRRCAALVSSEGSIDWFCRPRFDSPAVYGRLLDPDAGHWSIRPVGPFHHERSYVGETLVLRTVFTTDTGTAHLIDAMAIGPSYEADTGVRLRLASRAPRATLRVLECTAGEVDIEFVFRPRPEFGLVKPIFTNIPGGILATGGPVRFALTCPVPLDFSEDGATARFTLRAGDKHRFVTQSAGLAEPPPATWTHEAVDAQLEETIQGWQHWSDAHPTWDGPLPHLVRRSLLVLEALRYQPTGAIIAAPTTSLPEAVGSGRNWDYRYAWIRDASFTIQALAAAGSTDEAIEFFEFITRAAAHYHPENPLQIMFGVGGEHDLSERELTHLSGWRGSRPVRIGNAAWQQPQLDVYGELLDAAWQLRPHLAHLDPAARRFLTGVADAAADQWGRPDQGIWESRGDPRHYTYSKLMCWVALDRAVKHAEVIEIEQREAMTFGRDIFKGEELSPEDFERVKLAPGWAAARDRIREAIETHAWKPELGAFGAAFDGDDLDAAVLLLPAVGFLPGNDPRVISTVDVIAERLREPRGLVRRYASGTDGLEGDEGAFVMCTFWLAQALALTGRVERAREVFEEAAACANDLGLMSEEVDTATGEMLGNYPQAFSHIGLINAAVAIRDAERR